MISLNQYFSHKQPLRSVIF